MISKVQGVRFELFACQSVLNTRPWRFRHETFDDRGELCPTSKLLQNGDTQLLDTALDFREVRHLNFSIFAALASVGKQGRGSGRGGGGLDRAGGVQEGADGSETQQVDLAAAEAAGYALDALPLNTLILHMSDGDYIPLSVHRSLLKSPPPTGVAGGIGGIGGGQATSQAQPAVMERQGSTALLGLPASAAAGVVDMLPSSGSSRQPTSSAKHDFRRSFDGINRLLQLRREENGAQAATEQALASIGNMLADGSDGRRRQELLEKILAQSARVSSLRAQEGQLLASAGQEQSEAGEREERLLARLQALPKAAQAVKETAALLPPMASQLTVAQDNAMGVRTLLAGKQLCLLAELRTLYPLAEQDKGRKWSVRGIVLPAEKDMASAPEEAVSTALGYTCHTVFLLGKYLAIPLRYAPRYSASSSTMRDEVISNARGEFPLYGKGGDKEGMKVAVRMLQRCVKQLLCSQGLTYHDGLHMLANLSKLYTVLLDAPLPDAA